MEGVGGGGAEAGWKGSAKGKGWHDWMLTWVAQSCISRTKFSGLEFFSLYNLTAKSHIYLVPKWFI